MRARKLYTLSTISGLLGLLPASSAAQSLGVAGASAGTPSLCAPATATPAASMRLVPTVSLTAPARDARAPSDAAPTAPGGHLGALAQAQYRVSERLAFVAGVGPSVLVNSVPVSGEVASAPKRTVAGVWCAGSEAMLVNRVAVSAVVQSHGLQRLPRGAVTTEEWVRTATVVPSVRVGF